MVQDCVTCLQLFVDDLDLIQDPLEEIFVVFVPIQLTADILQKDKMELEVSNAELRISNA